MRRSSWPYHSLADLIYAGFEDRGSSMCRYPRCSAAIHWFKTPNGKTMPLDAKTFEPHFATCVDRVEFRRRRAEAADRRARDRADGAIAAARSEAQCSLF